MAQLSTDKKVRKETPITSGVLDYFPDAIAAVARVSFKGNQQHNPGKPLHWDRSKSMDHSDCIGRHMLQRGQIDTDGESHTAHLAWRALAMLQLEIENAGPSTAAPAPDRYIDLAPPKYFDPTFGFKMDKGDPRLPIQERVSEEYINTPAVQQRHRDEKSLIDLGCSPEVAKQIVAGITYCDNPEMGRYIYISGPMRGYDQFNFPAFDSARDIFVKEGFNVISPADIDRHADGPEVPTTEQVEFRTSAYIYRDFYSLYFIARYGGRAYSTEPGAICVLPGSEASTGAMGEFFLARWMGLEPYLESGRRMHGVNWPLMKLPVEKYIASFLSK